MHLLVESIKSKKKGTYWRIATDRRHKDPELLEKLKAAADSTVEASYQDNGYNICLWPPAGADCEVFAREAQRIFESFYGPLPEGVPTLAEAPCQAKPDFLYVPDASLRIRAVVLRDVASWHEAWRQNVSALQDLPGVSESKFLLPASAFVVRLANTLFLPQKENIAAVTFQLLRAKRGDLWH